VSTQRAALGPYTSPLYHCPNCKSPRFQTACCQCWTPSCRLQKGLEIINDLPIGFPINDIIFLSSKPRVSSGAFPHKSLKMSGVMCTSNSKFGNTILSTRTVCALPSLILKSSIQRSFRTSCPCASSSLCTDLGLATPLY